jgi:anaphase-promoting complex subunit 10
MSAEAGASVSRGAGASVSVTPTLEDDHAQRREVGALAVWSVTSAKPGNGVEMLRDENLDSYWQSDGAQPHLVNIQFQKKVRLAELAIYADYKHDESYTPNKISVRAGNSFHDLREIKVIELEEPVGWVTTSLTAAGSNECLRAYFVQLAILSNHQNGRDTHMRQVKIYGPRQPLTRALGHLTSFSTDDFAQYSTVR